MAREYINEFRVKPLTAHIIDIFEDFLEDHGVRIESSDKQMKENDEFEGNDAIIYGDDYSEISDDITEAIAKALIGAFPETWIDSERW